MMLRRNQTSYFCCLIFFVVALVNCDIFNVNLNVASGSTVYLSCKDLITDNITQYHFQWLKDGIDVRERNFRFFYQNLTLVDTLTFKDIRFDEAGLYECIVTNLVGNQTYLQRVFEINVQEKDEKLRFSHALNGSSLVIQRELGQSVSFNCHVAGAADLARHYQWSYLDTNKTLDNITLLKRGSEMNVLSLNDLEIDQGGTYSCVVSNLNGFIRREYTLQIIDGSESRRKAKEERKRKHRNEIIIICLSCVAALSLITIVAIFLSKCFKSHWWKWKTRRNRAHSYHYHASTSEPPQTPNGNVFKQITPW
ncbi:fibroblast growth factor receptor 4-like isoform X2 [Clytia hemisphaerica]|uniref:Soluble interferon alpha/beta receptor OPG204 n=1 Tax=Clytia hemisphaerica TaxID=252671 RepID=A0A7M5UYN2_9CNID